MNIVYHCTNNYVALLLLSIYSIYKYTNTNIKFHIIHTLDEKTINSVKTFLNKFKLDYNLILVNQDLLDHLKVPQTYYKLLKNKITCNLYEFQKAHNMLSYKEGDWTQPSLFYFILHEKLFGFSDYIFLDCDTILTTDINNIQNIPKEKDKICMARKDWAVEQFIRENITYTHYNTGVVRVTSNEIYHYIREAYVSTLKNIIHAKFAMQHDFSVVAKDRIQELDYYWNYSVKQKEDLKNENNPFVLHYNTIITNPGRLKTNLFYKHLIDIAAECKIKDCSLTNQIDI